MTAYGTDHSDDQATRGLLAAWALDALDEGERAQVEELLARDERAAAEAASFLATMAEVDEGLEQLPPRPELRETVLRRVAAPPQDGAPADAPSSPSAPRGTGPAPDGKSSTEESAGAEVVPLSRYRSSVRRGRWLGLAAAILLITTVASFGLWRGERAADDVELAEIETPQSDSAPAEPLGRAAPEQVEELAESILAAEDTAFLEMPSSRGGTIRVLYSTTEGAMIVTGSGLEDLPSDRAYQVWLFDEEGVPHPSALLAAAESSVTVQDDLAGYVQIGVTVEPSTGSQEPTSDPIAAAEL